MKRVIAIAIVLFCVVYGDSSFAATDDSAKDEIEKIKKTLAFEVDEVEDRTWIYGKQNANDKPWQKNILYMYLGQIGLGQKKYTWIRWKIGFRKSEWVFFDAVILNVDGDRIEIEIERTLREVIRGGIVEVADIQGNYFLLKRIAYSEKTIVRFSGKDYRHDFVVSNEQKAKLKRLLRYYDLVSN